EVRRTLSAGRFVDRIAQPDEIVEVLLSEVGIAWRSEVDVGSSTIRPHLSVGVAGKAEGNRNVRGRSGGGNESANLADAIVAGDEAVEVARGAGQTGGIDVDGVVWRRVGSSGEARHAGPEARIRGHLGREANPVWCARVLSPRSPSLCGQRQG